MQHKIIFEIIKGLENISKQELKDTFSKAIDFCSLERGELFANYNASLPELLKLKTIPEIFVAEEFKVPRPNSLLSPENVLKIKELINHSIKINKDIKTFRIHAAGKDSTVFTRIINEIENKTKLKYAENDADLKIKIFPSKQTFSNKPASTPKRPTSRSKSPQRNVLPAVQPSSWFVAVRVNKRPLSVRAWKNADMRGALNPCIANAMIRLLAPKSGNRVLNLMCGSGTLIAEALNYNQHLICTGVDSDNKAIEKCVENLLYFKNKFKSQIELVISDCKNLHFEDSKYDLVVSDLPWGEAISKKSDLKKTYKDTFKEISRVAKPNAKLGIITQRDELVKAELPLALSSWKLIDEFKVFQGGFTPTVFIFTR